MAHVTEGKYINRGLLVYAVGTFKIQSRQQEIYGGGISGQYSYQHPNMTDNKTYDEDLAGLESKRNLQHFAVYSLKKEQCSGKTR